MLKYPVMMKRKILLILVAVMLLLSVTVSPVMGHTLSELHSAGVACPTVDMGTTPVLTWGLGYKYGYECKDNVWKLWCFSNKEKIINFNEAQNKNNQTLIDYVYDFSHTLRECELTGASDKLKSAVTIGGAVITTVGAAAIALLTSAAKDSNAVAFASGTMTAASLGLAASEEEKVRKCNKLCDEAVNLFKVI